MVFQSSTGYLVFRLLSDVMRCDISDLTSFMGSVIFSCMVFISLLHSNFHAFHLLGTLLRSSTVLRLYAFSSHECHVSRFHVLSIAEFHVISD